MGIFRLFGSALFVFMLYGGGLFLPQKFRIWFLGGMVLFAVLGWLAEEHFPSIRQEFERMSCADIDLDYDETTGACVARKD